MEHQPALSILRLVSRLPWGFKSTRLLQDPFAVSGLLVQALVSGGALALLAIGGLRILEITLVNGPSHLGVLLQ
jgi:hypothetical protein